MRRLTAKAAALAAGLSAVMLVTACRDASLASASSPNSAAANKAPAATSKPVAPVPTSEPPSAWSDEATSEATSDQPTDATPHPTSAVASPRTTKPHSGAMTRDRSDRSRARLTPTPRSSPSAKPGASQAPRSGRPVPDSQDSGRGEMLWTGDVETGDLSQFKDTPWNTVGGDAPRVVEEPAGKGRYAVRMHIPGAVGPGAGICCGGRSELEPDVPYQRPGDDLFFGWSTYLERGFPVQPSWQVISQWHASANVPGLLALIVEDGQFKVHGGPGADGSPEFRRAIAPAITGVWSHWIFHVKFSANPDEAFVEVWQNGQLVVPRFHPGCATLYPGSDSYSYLKMGYYRNPDIDAPGTIYFDNWRIGTSRAAVD